MHRIKYTVILLLVFIMHYGCKQKQGKWSAANFEVKKRPSIHYSEIVSGKLDSSEKAEHELVKKIKAKKQKSPETSKNNVFTKLYHWLKAFIN